LNYSIYWHQNQESFKRDEIFETKFGANEVVGGRTIDVHIRKLREKR
jgi:DNA-binding response OmpR family regulator